MSEPRPEMTDQMVEDHAATIECQRHRPQMRGCAYQGGEPCACRARVERRAKALSELAELDGEMML